MEEYLGTVMSVTSDMGTELGVADMLSRVTALLPNFVKASHMQTGEEEGKHVEEWIRDFIFSKT